MRMRKLSNWLCLVVVLAGVIYVGVIVKRNSEVFFYLEVYTKAIRGDVREQLRLGQMFEQAKFTECNYKKAKHWYRKAAIQGNKAAILILCKNFSRDVSCDDSFIENRETQHER